MNCPVCHAEPAIEDITFGILPGEKCKQRRSGFELPKDVHEFTSDEIRRGRNTHAKTLVQPFNSAGVFSDEYYQAYGTKGVKVTPEQIAKRKRVWDRAISPNMEIAKTK